MNYLIAIVLLVVVIVLGGSDGSPKENGSLIWLGVFIAVVAIGGGINILYKKK